MRVLNAGISQSEVCGVRDAAKVLEAALIRLDVEASTIWCDLSHAASPRQQWSQVRGWLGEAQRHIGAEAPDAVILHYSVFAYGFRGVPVFAPVVSARIACSRVPVVGYLHEFAYSFGLRGWRGTVQALTQRAALPEVVRRCSLLVATTERRVHWLETRSWLARRSTLFLPVYSNLPPTSTRSEASAPEVPTIGVFGFASPGSRPDLVAKAVHLLRRQSREVRVLLVGAPGESSDAGGRWRDAFLASGCGDVLSFTGVLDLQELSVELDKVELFVFPETGGPESRRGTLAAELGAGKTVIALDGTERWERAVAERALVLVEGEPHALAGAIERFSSDSRQRADQEGRAADFYRCNMSPDIVAGRLVSAIASIQISKAPVLAATGNS